MGKASRKKDQQTHQPPSTKAKISSPGSLNQSLFKEPAFALFLLTALPLLIYSNSFNVPFYFDDMGNIVNNPIIRDLSNFMSLSSPRYIGILTLGLNYHFGQLNVFGYHLVNLMIHMVNGILVYYLVLLLFRTFERDHESQTPDPQPLDKPNDPFLESIDGRIASAPWVALAVALLFTAHPIQTQAVTYIVQRFASLATLFYLFCVVTYLKYRLSPPTARSRLSWYILALLSTLMAMKTKEISFTLPFMLIFVEAVFFRPTSKGQWLGLIPFLLTLPIIPLSHPEIFNNVEAGTSESIINISRSNYLLTQFPAMMTYLRLLILPIRQNIDYDYPIYHSLLQPAVLLSFLFLLCFFGLAIFLTFNPRLATPSSRLIGFGLLWFFVTSSIESSIIPIADTIFEHRLYLPSAGFFLAFIQTGHTGLNLLKTRLKGTGLSSYLARPAFNLYLLLMILLPLSVLTYQRNELWNKNLTLWQDAVSKSPDKLRPHYNLAVSYHNLKRYDQAIEEYKKVLTLEADYPWLNFQAKTNFHLATLYKAEGRLEKAVDHYRQASILQPDLIEAHNGLGITLADLGRLEEALDAYRKALEIDPDYVKGYNNLGNILADLGRPEQAVKAYEIAIKLKPNYAKAHSNLGVLLRNRGRIDEAIKEFQTAISLSPDDPNAHYNLGGIYDSLGKQEDAQDHYDMAFKIDPNFKDPQKTSESSSLKETTAP